MNRFLYCAGLIALAVGWFVFLGWLTSQLLRLVFPSLRILPAFALGIVLVAAAEAVIVHTFRGLGESHGK